MRRAVRPLFEVDMSPGSVTERRRCFAAPYVNGEQTARAGVAADAKAIMVLPWAERHGLPA